jgi:ABC-type antimicrobial peptide transport system permease subunit
MFPVFRVEVGTVLLAIAVAVLAGVSAAVFPVFRTLRRSIVDGLRAIG